METGDCGKKDRLSHRTSIGVVGNGFVGGAVVNGFGDYCIVNVFDSDPDRCYNTYNETIFSDIVFVCLPTPMLDVEGGDCNLSILENFFDELPTVCDGIFIIKSTVPVGTTERLVNKYPHLKIIHNPEFLTAANANDDFINADRTVLGGKKEWVEVVQAVFEGYFSDIPVITMTSNESECVKYFANCFLATKVMVFNEMFKLTDHLNNDGFNVNYDKIMTGVISDRRIGESHYHVPGPDGDLGFGGTCFPKDINALIHTMNRAGVDPLILSAVWEQNKKYRTDWDWAESKSAVLSESES